MLLTWPIASAVVSKPNTRNGCAAAWYLTSLAMGSGMRYLAWKNICRCNSTTAAEQESTQTGCVLRTRVTGDKQTQDNPGQEVLHPAAQPQLSKCTSSRKRLCSAALQFGYSSMTTGHMLGVNEYTSAGGVARGPTCGRIKPSSTAAYVVWPRPAYRYAATPSCGQ